MRLFDEAVDLDRFQLGGKGYGLVEMNAIGLPVPPGLIITTEACKKYYAQGGRVPDGLFGELRQKLELLETQTGRQLGNRDKPLFMSVRSGAPYSMPGMMDTILNLGVNEETAETLTKKTGNERFGLDAHRRFIQMFGKIALGVNGQKFEDILESQKKRLHVKQDIELPPSELRIIIQEFRELIRHETGRDLPRDPWAQLEMAVEAVFRSWSNPRAVEYRRYYKIPDNLGTAVTLQQMVFGNTGEDSGTGVGFTRNPSTGEKKLYGEYLRNAQGEDVVAGIRTPDSLDAMPTALRSQLSDVAMKLENHFKEMQDFEFTVENGKFYLLQTRNGKRTAQAAVKIAVDMVGEKLLNRDEAIARINPGEIDQLLHRTLDPKANVKAIAKGLNASPGAASGIAVFDTEEAARLGAKGDKVILVRPETTPEDIRGIIRSQGILTVRGGMTSHAAVVARGMGKAAVVGCSSIRLDLDSGFFKTSDGMVVKRGELITIDGSTGEVMLGNVPMIEPELTDDFRTLLEWADKSRRLGVWANADTPDMARKAKEFGAEGIGLCRTERMFNAPERLPIVREMIMAEDEDHRKEALRRLIPFQLSDFKEMFRLMAGKPVTVRLLDLPLHEFLPSAEEVVENIETLRIKHASPASMEKEARLLAKVHQLSEHNPMLGHRGCRLAVTYPEIYEAQTEAILRAAIEVRREIGQTVRVLIMLPLISDVNEMIFLRKRVEKAAENVFREMEDRIEYKIGTMIETPRAALTAGELAKCADFFSFGTNDLTQTTYAFSRDDAEAKFMARYLEDKILNDSPFEVLDTQGVGRLVKLAKQEGRSANPHLEVGICGEHGGEPKSVMFFHETGLDYVSCSAYRIPVARIAAAQAAISSTKTITTV
ncbi:MAG TPA: pyruvate, phosphate dikinase [Candidatus Dormibacteraeota bacterium]|nr:pyruvate, phosphate dikinase [Candidatus Dormibacteraeota bacterium]